MGRSAQHHFDAGLAGCASDPRCSWCRSGPVRASRGHGLGAAYLPADRGLPRLHLRAGQAYARRQGRSSQV